MQLEFTKHLFLENRNGFYREYSVLTIIRHFAYLEVL